MSESVSRADEAMKKFAIHEALAEIWNIVDETNGYLTEQEPWTLAKSDEGQDRLNSVLYQSADALRVIALLLHPFMPKSTTKLWRALGQEGEPSDHNMLEAAVPGGLSAGAQVGRLEPLFPRIEQSSA
tara:strand:- start:24 stop:407 length:384 start_codon:yes stop_codon:yes gene_type:complete